LLNKNIGIIPLDSLKVHQYSESFVEEQIKTDIEKYHKYQELIEYLEKFKNYKDQVLLSIVIPVYNEEKTIKKVIESLPQNNLIEIIVVDDHSTDNSLDEIEKIRNIINIILLKHKRNRGYGNALLTGIKYSKGRIIITMDADGQHNPFDILSLIKPILKGKADISVGSRYLGSYNYKLPLTTRLGEVLIEKLLQILFKKKIMNNQSGYRAFDRKTISIFEQVNFQDFAFTTEVLLQAALKNYKIKEYPIVLSKRKYGTSKIILRKLILSLITCFSLYSIKKLKSLHTRKLKLKGHYLIRNPFFMDHPIQGEIIGLFPIITMIIT
jgi:glycosyltransferase involved in cell wall biosynthesis